MSFYKSVLRRLLFRFDPETAHEIGITALRLGLAGSTIFGGRSEPPVFEEFGPIERFGLRFNNPVGMAAGFDKNGVVVNRLAALGFGFVEVGTVTIKPQPGNPKPRMFRLPEDHGLINRLGFNNEGTNAVIERLRGIERKCVVGVNIGKNKDVSNDEAIENYVQSFDLAHQVADYIAVNVSSPNTPNLRELQKAESLEELLGALCSRNEELSPKPLLVKIAPDLSEGEIEAIVDIAQRLKLSGIIATNTTISRDGLKSTIDEAGGLSGRPLTKRSTDVISTIYKAAKGSIPIVGVGGVFTAVDAFEKIAAGASLIQAYTGFVYQGTGFAADVNTGVAKIIREKGFKNLDEAVGSAH